MKEADDTINADKDKINESLNEINELIDSISATTPIKTNDNLNSIDVRMLEESK